VKTGSEFLDIGVQSSNGYKQSANTLFNFMRDFDFLIKDIKNMKLYPRYVTENVEYLNLTYGNRKVINVAFPMLCFCDINLHKLSLHVEEDVKTGSKGYGKYGVGLDKDWCIKKGLQPVSYLNEKSKKTLELSEIFNKGLEQMYNDEPLEKDFFDFILTQLRFSKPLAGKMIMDNDVIEKNFHDEREWRYIPNMSQVAMDDFLNDATMPKKMAPGALKEYSNTLTTEPSTHIELTLEAIKYIFVATNEDREVILKVIRDNNKDNVDDALLLASKVVVYEEMERDW